MTLLAIEKLGLSIGERRILRDVSLTVDRGERVGLVGESGSGKSLTALSVLGLLPAGSARSGSIRFDGQELLGLLEETMTGLRGDDIGLIFQEPMTALNPLMTIGDQVAETVLIHKRADRAGAHALARETLARVGLAPDDVDPGRYPHELSGGQRQRVGIAIAVALKPRLLIADEPTTALDVTTQAQILDLLDALVREDRMGLLLISHDLAVISQRTERMTVLRAGEVVESGATRQVLGRPEHAYTRQLMAAALHIPERRKAHRADVLLDVEGVTRDYVLPGKRPFALRRSLRALDEVSLVVGQGESVGIVGASGSGKSTLARAILGLERPQAGRVRFKGISVELTEGRTREIRRNMQMVFQDPYGSFNPRHKVERLVAEPLHILGNDAPHGAARRKRVEDALVAVGLDATDADRYIHEFSGGQRQRIAIARALIVEPALVVLDEPVSALDVSIRAQILDLLASLSDRLGLAYLFISHDLSVVRAVTDRVIVMENGRIVEEGATMDVLDEPRHPYTQALIAAAPRLATEMDG